MGAGQANFSQCWLASFGMIYKFYNQPIALIEQKLSARGIDVADAKVNGLTDRDYFKAGEALGMTTWSGTPFKKPQGFFDVGDSDGCEAFLAELVKGPLWVSRYVSPGYHAVVATGYINPSWDEPGYIIFNNPFPGPNDAREDRTMRGNMFVKQITDARGSVMAFRR
jgi:Papain-like cysteine protease AvrRpt2